MKHIFLLLLLVFITFACDSEILPENEAISREKNTLFSIKFTTSDWKLVNQQGIDSYVGYYENDVEKIHFDYGWYPASLNRAKSLYFEEAQLKKCDCNIFIAKEKTLSGTRLTAVIFKQDKADKTTL